MNRKKLINVRRPVVRFLGDVADGLASIGRWAADNPLLALAGCLAAATLLILALS